MTINIMRDNLKIPKHIAIIMDGNGRWANSRGLPRIAGHREGAKAVRKIVKKSSKIGVEYLTLYSFSSENWKRPDNEISSLMGLLRRYLKSEIVELHGNNVRFKVIGERDNLDDDIVRLIKDAENMTERNTGLTLILALSYGGRQEIVAAVRNIAKSAELGLIKSAAVDADVFAAYLDTAGVPDPDLLIRTSGEQRISNFLLWQLAYAELYFTNKFWPEFNEDDLITAIENFQNRDRRFGATANDRK